MLIIPRNPSVLSFIKIKITSIILLIQNRHTYCIPKYMFTGLENSNPRSNFKFNHSDRLASSFSAIAGGSTYAL